MGLNKAVQGAGGCSQEGKALEGAFIQEASELTGLSFLPPLGLKGDFENSPRCLCPCGPSPPAPSGRALMLLGYFLPTLTYRRSGFKLRVSLPQMCDLEKSPNLLEALFFNP